MSIGLAISRIAQWTALMLNEGDAMAHYEGVKLSLAGKNDAASRKALADAEKKLQTAKTKHAMARDAIEMWKDVLRSWLALGKLFNELLRPG